MKFTWFRCAHAARFLVLPFSLLFAEGCTGVASTGSARGEPTNTDSDPGGPQVMPGGPQVMPGVDPTASALLPGPKPLRRLTNFELKNTMWELLAVDVPVPETLPRDVLSESGFSEGSVISRLEAEAIMEWTGTLAQQGVARIMASAPCATAPADRALQDECVSGFISNFGMRAFRRPVTAAESTEFFSYYRDVLRTQQSYGFEQSIGVLAHLMLQSPRFLYHAGSPIAAMGPTSGAVRLDAYELASRMSYFLSGSMPDASLFEAALNGRLASTEGIQQEARRLLSDPQSKVQIEEIMLQWLGIEDLRKKIKDARYSFTPELGQAMVDETRRLVESVLDGEGTLASLLLSRTAYVDNGALAALYGHPGFTGNNLTPLQLKETERSGILTRAAFLTSKSLGSELNPIKRGLAVVGKLLCLNVPPPPAGFVPPDHVDPGLSTREFLKRHDANACASACHAIFTPAGFAFENYDGVGAYRTVDGAETIDASASVYFPDGTTRPVVNALELSQLLAADAGTGDCFADHWFRRALRRRDIPNDEGHRREVKQAFRGATGNIRELMVALVTSTAFTHRSLESAK